MGWSGHLRWAALGSAFVVGECLVLAMNRGRCPVTDWAGPLAFDRADNFDIYLPRWLARYNKRIFGALFVVGEAIVLWRWLRRA